MPKPSATGLATAIALKDGDLTVTAIKVAHEPVEPAFGYRFDYKGRTVVISGDTRKWPPGPAQADRGPCSVGVDTAGDVAVEDDIAGCLAGSGARLCGEIAGAVGVNLRTIKDRGGVAEDEVRSGGDRRALGAAARGTAVPVRDHQGRHHLGVGRPRPQPPTRAVLTPPQAGHSVQFGRTIRAAG